MSSNIELSYIEQQPNWKPELGPEEQIGLVTLRKHGTLLPHPYQGRREFRFAKLAYKNFAFFVLIQTLGSSFVALGCLPKFFPRDWSTIENLTF